MSDFFRDNKGRIILIILSLIIALGSFFGVAEKASSPETYEKTIAALDEKKMDVAEMTVASTAASIAIAAVPGDSTTPIANKIADLSGYFLMITTLILLEKYLLTLSGMLVFKVLIPIGALALIVYLVVGDERFKGLALRVCAFALAFFLVVPTSVYVSNVIEDTYEVSVEQSIEQEMDEIDQLKAEGGIGAAGSVVKEKAENIMSRFIDGIAVMFITTLLIPVGVFFVLLNLVKWFMGRDYSRPAVEGVVNVKKNRN